MERRKVRNAWPLTPIACAVGLSLAVAPTHAAGPARKGERVVQALRANTVAIRAEWTEDGDRSDGFGFITAIADGATYIATANHVVRGYDGDRLADTVTVRFFGDRKGRPAEVLKAHDATLDVGVIKVKGTPKRPWFRSASGRATPAGRGTAVWFVGRSGTWYVPAQPGTVNYQDPDLGLVIEGLSVTVGTSGAPLISEHGIVGLMTTDAAGDLSRACPIQDVRAQLESWEVPWQLVPVDLSRAPAGTTIGPQATADAARLAARLQNFAEAGAAAKRAFAQSPTPASARLLLLAAVKGPWRMCLIDDAGRCVSENPYGALAQKALTLIKARDPQMARAEDVMGAEVRLLRMQGETDRARQRAEEGLAAYPTSHWFLAEVGRTRALTGDDAGLAMLAKARDAQPTELLYRLDLAFAQLARGRPIAAAETVPTYQDIQGLFQTDMALFKRMTVPLSTTVGKALWTGLTKLVPEIEADSQATRFDYQRLATLMEKHRHSSGQVAETEQLWSLVSLRLGRSSDALQRARAFIRRKGGLSRLLQQAGDKLPDDRKDAQDVLRYYHQILSDAKAEPAERHAIEQYGGLTLAPSSPHVAYRSAPFPVIDGYPEDPRAVALAEPPTKAVVAFADGIRRYRLPSLEPDAFVTTDSPVCAVATSADGRRVAFVTKSGQGYVWRVAPKPAVAALGGRQRLSCAIDLSRDGRTLVASTAKQQLVYWRGRFRKPPKQGPPLPWPPTLLSLGAKDQILLAADGRFAFGRLADNAALRTFTCGPLKPEAISIDGLGLKVASAADKTVEVCEAPSGRSLRQIEVRGSRGLKVKLFDQGRQLFAQRGRSRGRAYGVVEGEDPRGKTSIATSDIVGLQISDDGNTAIGWEPRRNDLTVFHRPKIKSYRWDRTRRNNDKRRRASVALDAARTRLALLWETRNDKRAEVLNLDDLAPACTVKRPQADRVPALSATGRLMLFSNDRRYVHVYDESCQGRTSFSEAALSPSGATVVRRKGPDILLHPSEDDSAPTIYACELDAANAIGWSPDERHIVAVDHASICFVDRNTNRIDRKRYRTVSTENPLPFSGARSMTFSPDGKQVLVFDAAGTIDPWRLATKTRSSAPGPQYRKTRHPPPLPRGLLDPGGATVLVLSGDGDLTRWDLNSGALVQSAAVGHPAFDIQPTSNPDRLLLTYGNKAQGWRVRVVDRRSLATQVTVRGFAYGRWLVYRPNGECWAPPGTIEGIVPAFQIRGDQIKRTMQTCEDTSALQALKR